MKAHTQTIINVALAIAVTLLIYQNNQLQDNIETVKGYAQLDTDKAWERMDTMAEDIANHEDNLKILYDNWDKQLKGNEVVNGVLDELEINMDIAFKNFDISKSNFDNAVNSIESNSSKIEHIQDFLVENFGG